MNYVINPLDRNSPVPLYQQLTELMREMIEEGKLATGETLPSENALMREYGVSRHVVRHAINELRWRGLIQTERGRGSFVAPSKIDKALDMVQSYHKAMRDGGHEPDVRVIEQGFVECPDNIAPYLGVSAGDQVFELQRVSLIEDVPVNYLDAYVSPTLFDHTVLRSFRGGSFHAYLAEQTGIRPEKTSRMLQLVFAREKESRLLNVSRGSPLIEISGLCYDQHERPWEYSRVVYIGSLFRFHFNSQNVLGGAPVHVHVDEPIGSGRYR